MNKNVENFAKCFCDVPQGPAQHAYFSWGRVRGSVNMMEIQKNVDWVQVNGAWTRRTILGVSLSPENLVTDNKGEEDNRVIICMIPGNPGNDALYTEFGKNLIRNLMAREERLRHRKVEFLFYIVSNINHVILPPELRNTAKQKVNERFDLNAQIQHKFDFIVEHLPRGNRVYLLGHNTGAYILLRILPYVKNDFNVKKAICISPKVEKMANSSNGIRLRKIVSTLNSNDWLTKFITWWMDSLPSVIKKYFIKKSLSWCYDENFVLACTEILHVNVFRNIIHLANDEIEKIGELDENLLFNKDLIYMYCGNRDMWCPVDQAEKMKNYLARGHVVIDSNFTSNSFFFRDALGVSNNILQFII